MYLYRTDKLSFEQCHGYRIILLQVILWFFNFQGMYVNFELTLTNGDSLFFKHFSADEFCKYSVIPLCKRALETP